MALVTIRYCTLCMYKQRASRLAEFLREHLPVEVQIESGGFGEFSVLLDDQIVLKRTSLALPSEQEFLNAVRATLEAAPPGR
jgi:selT/selW/selH-like putative selenoprotein